MKLVDYIKRFENELNPFIICINTNCNAFRKAKEGVLNVEEMEELTFFRAYIQNILKNKEALDLLKDVEYLDSDVEEEIKEEKVLLVTVSCGRNYSSIKHKLSELLN